MRLIKSEAKVENFDYSTVYEKLEQIGRVCYKSEHFIGKDTEKKFLKAIISSGHLSVVEHHVFILEVMDSVYEGLLRLKPDRLKYINLTKKATDKGIRCLVSGSTRGFLELGHKVKSNPSVKMILNYLKFHYPILFGDFLGSERDWGLVKEVLPSHLSKDERRTHEYVTVKFVCDRATSHQIVRHRPASFAQESQRYVNYTKGMFGKAITFVAPPFFTFGGKNYIWKLSMKLSEMLYFVLIKLGAKPEEARSVLPNSTKTELYMTASLSEWMHFIKLRADKTAQSQIRELAIQIKDQLPDL